jgi:hypothetical protein
MLNVNMSQHENAAQRAAAKKTERGSSAEDDSTDATSEQASSRPSAPPTPSTPAEGYSAVLDSVRAEIVQAEAIMSTVTSTFGVDDDRSCCPLHVTTIEPSHLTMLPVIAGSANILSKHPHVHIFACGKGLK